MRRLAVVLGAALLALLLPGGAHAWSWPVDGPVPDRSPFGRTRVRRGTASRNRHRKPWSASRSARRLPGRCRFAGSVPAGGRALTIRTPDGYLVTLLQLGVHLGAAREEVAEGAGVGAVGESADAVTREAHLHLGVRRTAEEEGFLDPPTLLPGRSKAAVPPPVPCRRPRRRRSRSRPRPPSASSSPSRPRLSRCGRDRGPTAVPDRLAELGAGRRPPDDGSRGRRGRLASRSSARRGSPRGEGLVVRPRRRQGSSRWLRRGAAQRRAPPPRAADGRDPASGRCRRRETRSRAWRAPHDRLTARSA